MVDDNHTTIWKMTWFWTYSLEVPRVAEDTAALPITMVPSDCGCQRLLINRHLCYVMLLTDTVVGLQGLKIIDLQMPDYVKHMHLHLLTLLWLVETSERQACTLENKLSQILLNPQRFFVETWQTSLCNFDAVSYTHLTLPTKRIV